MSSGSSAARSRDDAVVHHQTMRLTSKICGVCGDIARCYHFGGLCCASCKAFFRRAVVNGQYKSYRCLYGGSCKIDVTTRKHCSHCRLKRCLSIGMDKKWFMSEEMRLELKNKSLKKLKTNPQEQTNTIRLLPFQVFRPIQVDTVISFEQIREIYGLAQNCRVAYQTHTIPKEVQSDRCANSSAETAVVFSVAIQRSFSFLESVPQTKELDPAIRTILLKEHGMEALIVLSSLTFNPERQMWLKHYTTLLEEPVPLHVCMSDFERLHGPQVTRKHFDIVTSLLNLNADEHIITLLSLVAFFTLDQHTQSMLSNGERIVSIQEHFIDLLKRYVSWKFAGDLSEKIFARYILKLSDVREVNNLYKVEKLRLSNDEIHQVEQQMGGLELLKFTQQ